MTERTLNELASAEIVPNMGGPNSWLVRFGEDDYDTVNKSGKNTLLLNNDMDIEDTVSYGGIMVVFDLEADEITLHDGDNDLRVPDDKHDNVLWAVYDEDGTRLNRLFDDLYVPTVRQGLMDMLMPRFRNDNVDMVKIDEGWLIDDSILVSWDASNSPVNNVDTHIVSGSETVRADADKDARDITFNLPDESTVALPNGTRTSLNEVEMKFLTSVALILGSPPVGLYDDGLATAVQQSRISAFTDVKSGLHHDHDIQKHTLSDLGVTDEATERLWYNDHDHAGVWELALREDEFKNAPIDVFEDASNVDARKWEKIASTKGLAPIPKHVRSDLNERYE